MNKLAVVLFFLFSFSVTAFAQNQTIKGTITDETGAPIKGVSVFAKGAKKGTQTDAAGHFSISIKEADKYDLIISAVGYKSSVVTTNGKTEVSIKLEQDVIVQDEVVVNVGYGTLKKKEVSSAVSSITAKDIKDMPINNASEALTGRLAGVQVTTSEGAPDADVKITVRGGGSITQSNDPLYIVDGVQVDNGLSTIAPQDIQSIDVLKDAAATAIYGARGANGVIIVTTKNARQGKLTVNFNTAIGIKKLYRKLDVLDPYEMIEWDWERSSYNINDRNNFINRFGSSFDTLQVYKQRPMVNWQDEIMGRTGIVANNNISVSGGNNVTTFTAGYTNNYERAILLRSDYKRNLFNAKIDIKPAKNIKFGVTGRYNNQNVMGAGVSDERSSSYNRLRNIIKFRPFLREGIEDPFDDAGEDENPGNGLFLINPLQLNAAEYRLKTTNAYNLTGYVSYNINKRLTFKTTVGYERSQLVDRHFSDSVSSISRLFGSEMPVVRLDSNLRRQFTNSNVLTYKLNNYRKRHDFDVVLGQEIVLFKRDIANRQLRYFPNFISEKDAFDQLGLGESFVGFPFKRQEESSLLSFFSRVNYTLSKKYIFSFNMRADGSSKFAPGRRWGYFPSGSFAWRISKEKFMDKAYAVSDLKLRLSYGTVGNNRIADYLYMPNFTSASAHTYYYGLNNQNVYGATPTSLANDLTRWETTVSKNIGIDISLFNDRLGLTVDVYQNNTRDLLLDVPIASSYGYTSQIQNVGETRNRGIEVQLNGTIIRKKQFSWNATFNLTSNRNIIVALGPGQNMIPVYSGWGISTQYFDFVAQVGKPVGSMYGLVTDGFYKVDDFNYNPTTQQYTLKDGIPTNGGLVGDINVVPGTIRYKDLNGDGKIDLDNDATIIGNAQPKFSGGLNQQFTYKNWDFSVFLNFVYGNSVMNANKVEFTNGYTPASNLLGIMRDRWKNIDASGERVTDPETLRQINANATIWSPIRGSGAAFQLHSWAIEDGSFLRINNVSIGYNFLASSLRRVGIKKLRMYLTANNLHVFTKYTGYDPEVSTRRGALSPGVDYSPYPRNRFYMFGINASF
ncbi:MAG TPA: TonB-dependent receptor [Ferruginibacter sp.]|nr:TonB-dependent receptor [Ferruginibacter sp.]HMP20557.1 TonB-dependent receptor [Ferruginibacter sp.]